MICIYKNNRDNINGYNDLIKVILFKKGEKNFNRIFHESKYSISLEEKINKGRVVFPSKTLLFKSLYLATEIITKKLSQQIRNWGQIYME